MGIQDRDYYREDSRWSNPFARSQATIGLVLLFGFLFIVQIATQDHNNFGWAPKDDYAATLALHVDKVLAGEAWRLVSYAIVNHPSRILQIVLTVVFLFWIGHQVEDIYGWKEYLAFFFVSTVLGGVAYTTFGAIKGVDEPLVGPSGAVTAIMVLFVMHYPGRMVFFLPAWLWLVIYAAQDVAGLAAGFQPARVAVHLAGAAFAFVYHTYTLRMMNWLPFGERTAHKSRRRPRPRVRVAQEQPLPEPAAAAATSGSGGKSGSQASGVDEHLEAKLDEVLEKVARTGRESLTEAEREVLMRASEIYKKRRQSS